MTGEWANSIVDAMIQAADTTGQGSQAFANEETARAIAVLAGFMRLGVRDGRFYDIQVSQSDPIGKPHLWQVTLKRREGEEMSQP